MVTLVWNQSFSVKISRFDEDHKHLFSLLNSLHEAISNGVGSAAVQPILDELADYATQHFAAEESLMEKTKFPELDSHRAEHQKFIKQMTLIQEDLLRMGSQSLALSVFLNEWATDHILHTDQRYSDHLNSMWCF